MSKVADEPSPAPQTENAKTKPGVNRRYGPDSITASNTSSRLWRIFSTREKIKENVKTLAWVVPITIIIWIYAERMQVVQTAGPNVSNITVQITSSDPGIYVEMSDNAPPTVNLKVTGPQQALERVKEALTASHGLHIDIGSMGIGSNQAVNIVDKIQGMNLFKANGISIQDSQPATLNVNVDELATSNLPVQVPPEMDFISAETHFEPPSVMVRGPNALIKRLGSSLKVYANLSNFDLKKEGAHSLSAVPLILSSPQDKLKIDPMQVNGVLVVQPTKVTYRIPSMPIFIKAQPETLKNYKIEIASGEESVADVNITGPQDRVKQVRDMVEKQNPPQAVLTIEPEDSANPQPKILRYELPDGVTVSEKDAARTVQFTLTRRPD